MTKDQLGASIIHEDGAKMTYDILGAQFLGEQIPIVLITGMTLVRGDWDRLANALAEVRPVLLLDHRGMGESTYSTKGNEEITMELYARDILYLLTFLQWKEVGICGFSMGGVVLQQLLVLPYHDTNPTPLPFTITHAVLAATLPSPLTASDRSRYGLKLKIPPPLFEGQEHTKEEQKELARGTVECMLDEAWLKDPKNKERFEQLLETMTNGRPVKTILQQLRAVRNFDLGIAHSLVPSSISILVIHGQNDQVIPFSCSTDILSLIPHAKAVAIGSARGEVPDLKFGHLWYEYFDITVWVGVFEEFMKSGDRKSVV